MTCSPEFQVWTTDRCGDLLDLIGVGFQSFQEAREFKRNTQVAWNTIIVSTED